MLCCMSYTQPERLALRCLAALIVAVLLLSLKEGLLRGLDQALPCSLIAPALPTQGWKTFTAVQADLSIPCVPI